MPRRPYVPDLVGDAAYPTQPQSRVGFSETMEPVYGNVIDDILTPEVRDALVPAAYTNAYGVTNSNAEQGAITDKSGDALTSALGILDKTVAAWRWDGFSVQLPSMLTEAVNVVSDVLDTIIGFMEAVKALLEIAAAFMLSLGDALKILIDNLKKRLDEMLSLFTGKTGVYGIHIPLSMPLGPDMAARIDFLKKAKVAVKNVAAKGVTGVGLSESGWAGRTMLSMLPDAADFSGTVGGNEGFIATLRDSLADPLDYNKPEFGPNAWVGGYVVMYGGTDLTRLLTLWGDLKKLFGNFFGNDPGPASPPGPKGLALEVLSPKMTAIRGLAPRVHVRWDRPSVKFSLSSFYPQWVPVADVVYSTVDSGDYTPAKKAANLLRINGFETGTQPDLGLSEKAIYRASILPGSHVDETFTSDDLGRTYAYRIGRRFKYAYGSDDYAIDPNTGAPGILEVLSDTARVLLPYDAKGSSTGTLPNWFSASLAELLPQCVIDLIEDLKVVLKRLLDLVSDFPSVLLEIIQSVMDELQRWVDLANRLKALLELIKSVLDIGAGAFAMGFFGLGGNDFLMNTLTSSIANAPDKGRSMSQVSQQPDQAAASITTRVNKLGLRIEDQVAKGSFTDFLSGAHVPDFGPSDSVGGFVLMAGDESMQAALQTYKILQTLFGGGDKVKSKQALQYDIDQMLQGLGGSGLGGPTIEDILGPAPVADKAKIFDENMVGTGDPGNKGDSC